jgi:hypothetical protein
MTTAVDFYEENSHLSCSLPEIPKHLNNDLKITNWIFTQNIPFIELDLAFDTTQWQTESQTAEKFYVTHRESQPHQGWKSCCIHGIDIDKTSVWQSYTDVEPEYRWTELANLTPTITDFCKKLPLEKFARIRFMKLEAEGWIAPHNDSPPGYSKDFKLIDHLVPINIAIDHPWDCYMTLKDHGIVPWKNGNVKIVNITNDHSVINFSKSNRVHLIAHGWIGNKINEFSELIVRSYRKQYERNRV